MSKKSLAGSLLLHSLVIIFLFAIKTRVIDPNQAKLETFLKVHSISEKEFKKEIEQRLKDQHLDQVIQMDDSFKDEKAPDQTLQNIYLSKYNQRADRNTKAAKADSFKNSNEAGAVNGNSKSKKLGANSSEKQPDSNSNSNPGFGAKTNTSVLTKGPSKEKYKKGKGISTNDDYIEGAVIGPSTIMNTQEFKYYSFYERIRAQLSDRWRTQIRKDIKFVKTHPNIYGNLSIGTKLTKLEVKIDERGEIISLTRLAECGIDRFDATGEKAMRDSAPFPAPPKELIKDGYFTLRWDFAVEISEASKVEFKMNEG